ncbi:trans-sulfuration enzyme family protein [Sediminispirochaeta smaragdinae]|uniref:Cys/Met metabolism pyridoxal-phosphate-dependent protein n=1 Tax=Sediminispirochaeta smaragdinae (strain DSM 11293 / JCM 15392 / SEBR 4228) TaxID=573413 RepID=E1R514_SEDSS|nr:aminotransferase class I/II-fold pyridoxal phosphate-dependent enzyme [Sediminispirochaeta smaragdinae]ADK80549.1 Cys/Met metabolism pyridoxal-phosphate-dependent protein [Sediminispirochaeta smaragdinae DSM 11293]
MSSRHGFETRQIHAGSTGPNPEKALNPPIFMTSTFTFDSIAAVDDVMSFRSDDYVYTRGNNPTLRLFENRMADLENGVGAVAFASGMAAISSTLFSLLKPGDSVVAHKTLYGSSHSVITTLLPRYGIRSIIADLTLPGELERKADKNTKLVYFETPANPDLSIIDIRQIAEQAAAIGAKVVVDNTFATPFLQRPLDLGAFAVVHSATKYLCGHGDVLGGVTVSKDMDYIHELKFGYMCEFGGTMSPFNAWLLLRGMKTLSLRMERHQENAKKVAKFLLQHPKVSKVLYPGLTDHPGHETAKKQMSGFGAMISFEVAGDLSATSHVVDAMKLPALAVSLGDCETLVELPAAMTHRGYDREHLAEFGLTESMIRLSIGLESVVDIIEDLGQALGRLS